MTYRFALTYLVVGAVGAVTTLLMDRSAFFALSGYGLLFAAVAVYALVGATKLRRVSLWRTSAGSVATIVGAILLAVLIACALPGLRTSSRKGFHLDARGIVPGMNLGRVNQLMSAYPLEKHVDEGYVAFTFRVDRDSEDRVIVDLTSDGLAKGVEVVTN